MSGLFGYFDPAGELPADLAGRMSAEMTTPSDRKAIIVCGAGFVMGCQSKGIYPGEAELLSDARGGGHALFTGRLLNLEPGEPVADGSGGPGDVAGAAEAAVQRARRLFTHDPGGDELARANGPFAAVLWDARAGRMTLITDRYGMYPLYLARYRSAVLFAGQIRGLLASGVVARTLDPVAVDLMLHIGELVGEHTLLQSVRIMPAGTRLILERSGARSERYWHYHFKAAEDDFQDAAVRLAEGMKTAVQRVCHASPRITVPLSGGLDSRVLLAACPDPAVVPSVTWGLAGCRDLRYAAAAAQRLGSPHQGFVYQGDYLAEWAPVGVWATEGQLPCTDFHVLPYVDEVARRGDVILNGLAGDVLLGGNFIKRDWWHAATRADAAAALWRWRDKQIPTGLGGGLYGPALERAAGSGRAAFIAEYLAAPGDEPMDAGMAFLLDNRIRRRTSCGTSLMRWRVESDQPFFDNDFLDLVCRLPHAWRFRHKIYLAMLRHGFPQAARVRWQRTGLPAGAPTWMMYAALGAHRLARGPLLARLFKGRQVSDFAGWMRRELRGYMSGALQDGRTLQRGLFQPDALRRIWSEHLDGRHDHSSLLGAILAVELFARLFVDGSAELLARCRVTGPPARQITLERAA